MLTTPMDILTQFPVRKTKKQKQAFREAAASYAAGEGWKVTTEQGSFGVNNLVIGDAEGADYLVTAHYDTCAWMPVPNFITPCSLPLFVLWQLFLVILMVVPAFVIGVGAALLAGNSALAGILSYLMLLVILGLMLFGPANKNNANDNTSGVVTALEIMRSMPENQRHKVCFVLFDLEEAGLLGSAAYRKAHRAASARQIVINLDCVGEGDDMRFFPNKALRRDAASMKKLYGCCGYFGGKNLLVADKGFAFYPSDQKNFPLGVGVAALKRRKKILYLDRIHTSKDTVLDQTNVNSLRAAITTLVTGTAAKKG